MIRAHSSFMETTTNAWLKSCLSCQRSGRRLFSLLASNSFQMDKDIPSSDSADDKASTGYETHDHLREFITNECKEQAQQIQLETDESAGGIGAERMNQFYQRALAESERMTNEVTKCHIQREKLYNELGTEIFKSWSHDHASEVLTDEQYHLWSNEEKKSKELSRKLRDVAMAAGDSGSDDASQ